METFKSYENKPATAIQERGDTDFMGRVTSTLTSIRGINRKDAYTLASHFNTMADLFQADKDQLADCQGLGPVKVQRLWEAFHQPFRKTIVAGMQEQQPAAGGSSSQPAGAVAAGGAVPAQVQLQAGPSTGAHPTQQRQQQQEGAMATAAAGQLTTQSGAGHEGGQQQQPTQHHEQEDDDWEGWEDGTEQQGGGTGTGQVAAGGTPLEAEQALLLQCTLAMPMEDAEYDSSEEYEEF